MKLKLCNTLLSRPYRVYPIAQDTKKRIAITAILFFLSLTKSSPANAPKIDFRAWGGMIVPLRETPVKRPFAGFW